MKRKKALFIALAISLNAICIFAVVFSVVSAIRTAENSSLAQNIENVRTLTDSSANKIELAIRHYTSACKTTADYINSCNEDGLTEEEIYDYFQKFYSDTSYNWQLIDGEATNYDVLSKQAFCGIALCESKSNKLSYNVHSYPELAKLFCKASEDTLGEITYTNEFSDCHSLEKSFAITTTIRVKKYDEATKSIGFDYRTLMMLIKSDSINDIITTNNNTNNLSFFDFSNVIVSKSGDYIISNKYFQGTNFIEYIKLYDSSFTAKKINKLTENLQNNSIIEPIFYKNNKNENCIYTLSSVRNIDWYVLSVVPVKSFHNVYEFESGFLRFFISFLLLFIVDIVFVLLINLKLREKTKEAEEANQAKSRFLSSMSHDIRTPLNAVIGMTNIAQKHLEENTASKAVMEDCIKTIRLSGDRLLTLINDVLDLTKIESGQGSLSPKNFSIADSLSKMIEIMQTNIKEKDFKFSSHIINVNHEYVYTDELRVIQIYMNILSNAIKYTQNGGTITVDLIEEQIPNNDKAVRFIYKVSDNGIGMDAKFIKTIFDRFSRAVDTRINTVQGTGIGMAIVKQLVDLLGGTIKIESEINVGSTFTITLDLPISQAQEEITKFSGICALIIDGDEILLETAKTALNSVGIKTDIASNGKDGISKALNASKCKTPYQFVFIDCQIDNISWDDAIEELREEYGNYLYIIGLSECNISEIKDKAENDRINGLITKPLFKSKLVSAIKNAKSNSETARTENNEKFTEMKLLVAEDNNINWLVIEQTLQIYGINPQRAENGKQAVDMVKNSEDVYDLIFMDIQMPIMNGFEATKAIRELEERQRADIPIYAMTADTFADDVDNCINAGMNGHIPKPIDIDKVIAIVKDIYRKRYKK